MPAAPRSATSATTTPFSCCHGASPPVTPTPSPSPSHPSPPHPSPSPPVANHRHPPTPNLPQSSPNPPTAPPSPPPTNCIHFLYLPPPYTQRPNHHHRGGGRHQSGNQSHPSGNGRRVSTPPAPLAAAKTPQNGTQRRPRAAAGTGQ